MHIVYYVTCETLVYHVTFWLIILPQAGSMF